MNRFLKIGKFIIVRDLEKLWVIFCETQSEFEILLLLECAPLTGEFPSQVEYGPISGFHV
jgi:hypothetical protein